MLTASIFDSVLNQLLDIGEQFCKAAEDASVPYRVVGGLAVFLHVDQCDLMAARLTPGVDVAILRQDLERLCGAVGSHGFLYRDGAFILEEPRLHRKIHLIFIGEKVRREYLEPVPNAEPVRSSRGFLIASVADLVYMKLTSFRLKDKVHIQDMDSVGLITPAIEADLPQLFLDRLAEVRATE